MSKSKAKSSLLLGCSILETEERNPRCVYKPILAAPNGTHGL